MQGMRLEELLNLDWINEQSNVPVIFQNAIFIRPKESPSRRRLKPTPQGERFYIGNPTTKLIYKPRSP